MFFESLISLILCSILVFIITALVLALVGYFYFRKTSLKVRDQLRKAFDEYKTKQESPSSDTKQPLSSENRSFEDAEFREK